MTTRRFAASFANGIPAFDNPTLVRRRRIPPIRLLRFGELALSDLDHLVIGLHDRIVWPLAPVRGHTGFEDHLGRNRIFSWRVDRLGVGLGLDWRRVLRGEWLVRRIGDHRRLRLFLGRRVVGHNPRVRTRRHLLRRRLSWTIGRSDRRWRHAHRLTLAEQPADELGRSEGQSRAVPVLRRAGARARAAGRRSDPRRSSSAVAAGRNPGA